MSSREPHRIRLRKPWQAERLPQGFRWRRTFHRPTGLGAADRVWIVVEGIHPPRSVDLNGQPLGPLPGPEAPGCFEATSLLRQRNELVLSTDPAPEGGEAVPPCPPCEVWIEIRSGES